MTIGITGPERKVPRRSAVVGFIIAAVVIGICLILLWIASDILVDWLWFSSIGYLQVFWTTIGAKAVVFFAIWTATAVILWLNGWLAVRFARRPPAQSVTGFAWQAAGNVPPADLLTFMRDRLPWPRVIAGSACFIALLVAAIDVGNWNVFLQFLYRVPFGADDPLYDKDISFYLFALPAYIIVKNWMLLTLVLSALFAGIIYLVHGDIEYDIHHRSMSPTAIAHGSALLGLLFVVEAGSYGLDRYLLLYGDNGVVVGASYTDVHIKLPVLWLLIGLSIVAAFASWANVWMRTYRLPVAAVLLVAIGTLVLSGVTPALFRQLYVKPSELQLEKPYIERNIALTRQAYNLHQVTAKPFAAEQNLTLKTLEANKATIENIRLWDWTPLSDTYAQLQVFYLRDIPPVADGGPQIREPRIYYGEERDSYVIVKGSTPEFDYPKGKDNAYAAYDGTGGIPIGATVWRGLFAYYFNDPNLILSSYITTDSRIMIRRNIRERVRTIAPFLRLDHDPYLVVSDGRMFWMQDAYTTSSYFPSAQPAQDLDLNYIRNSVKIVVDAYHGTVDFYLMDASDPVALTYQRIFPSLFKPFSAMPADLQKHIRYPEDLFLIQARLYQTYHMEAAEVFYNREDLWQFPRQPGGDGIATMAPYYIIMRLPGEPQAEFFLMLPMVPSRRDNMIAWLAARCDAPDYGKLIAYEFPKERLVYGPFQIEARINQTTEISQQLTLWNQMGSRVIRGANLLVIPIENSLLYVTPLYLRAEHGHLPELKRVIAAYGEHVVMKETLAEALAALFIEPDAAPVEPPVVGQAAGRAQEALDRYNRAVERLRSGDWKGFGTQFDAMRELLEEMSRQSAGH